jgi:tRNA-modifying protein YgfZ
MPTLLEEPRHWLRLHGADRSAWLNGLVTCNLASTRPGDAVYGLITEKKGKPLGDMFALVEPEEILLSVPAQATTVLLEHFERYTVMEDVVVESLDGARACLWIGGAEDNVPIGFRAVQGAAPMPNRIGILPPAAVWPTGPVLHPDAPEAARVRIDAHWPRFGRDFDASHYPQEAGVEAHAVSFNKGCYLGQEVICMLELRGKLKRRLEVLHSDAALPAAGTAVLRADTQEPAGELRTLSADGRAAFGFIKVAAKDSAVKLSAAGTTITIASAQV